MLDAHNGRQPIAVARHRAALVSFKERAYPLNQYARRPATSPRPIGDRPARSRRARTSVRTLPRVHTARSRDGNPGTRNVLSKSLAVYGVSCRARALALRHTGVAIGPRSPVSGLHWLPALRPLEGEE